MKRNLSLLKYALLIALCCVACVNEKDLYEPSGEDPGETEELDLSFKFALRSDKQIHISVTRADGKAAEGIGVGVYLQQPYEEDGIISGKPLYMGYTDGNGQIDATISVPANSDKLYVASLTAGYPGVQKMDVQPSMTCNLTATAFQIKTATTRMVATRSETGLDVPVGQKLSNLYELYSPYTDSEIGKDGIPLLNASPLVTKEELSAKFLNLMNSWYPEQKNVQDVDLKKSSDLVVTDELGAEVWATYVGDGGFYVNNATVYNVLAYYSYQEGELGRREDIQGHRMTLLLPNTHQQKCPSGLKVQLLYWDGKQYSKVFPKGARIGFAVARDGLNIANVNAANGGVNSKSSYKFKNQTFPNGDVNGFYYSTPSLNATKRTNAVIRNVPDYNCCIMGFDIRPYDDPKADYDFNDVMIKLTASPVSAIKPEEDIPVIDEFTPSEAVYGTLAFEDQWPKMGDYDFNDFVMNYSYELEKGDNNMITALKLTFTPIAKGAASWTHIGVGIELPLSADNIDKAKSEGATLEEGNDRATFIVWNDVNTAFGTTEGYVNTEGAVVGVSAIPVEVTVRLKTPVSSLLTQKFNPFIFVNSRQREIHLVDYKPTKHADTSLFGTENDRSDPGAEVYYRMDNRYPWALDFPRKEDSSPTWNYPKERVIITKAYPNYEKWVLDQSNLSWFDASVSGNVNKEFLY